MPIRDEQIVWADGRASFLEINPNFPIATDDIGRQFEYCYSFKYGLNLLPKPRRSAFGESVLNFASDNRVDAKLLWRQCRDTSRCITLRISSNFTDNIGIEEVHSLFQWIDI